MSLNTVNRLVNRSPHNSDGSVPTYLPGQEPEKIRNRIDTLFAKLDEAYPDYIIVSLARDHKKWGETVTELYRLLGYDSGNTFLEAYGYTVQAAKAGRKSSTDADDVIEELKKRYPDGPKFEKQADLIADNPDLAGKMKTLNNSAQSKFGMTLKDYLQNQGILISSDVIAERRAKEAEIAKEERERIKEEKKELKRVAVEAQQAEIEQAKQAKSDYEASITLELMNNVGIEFIDKGFVHTELDYYQEINVKDQVIKRGGRLQTTVNGKTNYLIANYRCDTVKYTKALELIQKGQDIHIITLKEFYRLMRKYDEYVASTDIIERAMNKPALQKSDVEESANNFTDGFVIEKGTLTKYIGKEKIVVIPDGVKIIGANAFYGLTIEIIQFPESVTAINKMAFRGCRHITEIELPTKLKKIGMSAFEECTNLQFIVVPDSVDEIGKYAFRNCSKLLSASIPDRLVVLGDGCFASCGALKEVNIPSTVVDIPKQCFYNCRSLARIQLHSKVKKICESAFEGCNSLTDIQFPDKLRVIEERSFDGCSALVEIKLSDGIKHIEYKTFYGCANLERAYLPSTITEIRANAFSMCRKMNYITLGNNLKVIGSEAFAFCSALSNDSIEIL